MSVLLNKRILFGVNKIQQLINHSFIRNVLAVASGTAFSQAITMVFSPLITRQYGPEAFGLLGVFTAVVSVLTPIAALTYPIAIVLPKDDREAKSLGSLSISVAAAIACVIGVLVLFAGDWLTEQPGVGDISSFLVLIPLVVISAALLQIAQQWMIRKKQFNAIARASVIQSLIINSSKAVIGYFEPIAAVLIVLTITGSALQAAMLWFGIKYSGIEESRVVLKYKNTELLAIAKKYRDFPVFRAPQAFLNPLSQSLPVLMLAYFFSPVEAGFYSLCRSVISMPTVLLSGAVGDVIYPRIAEAANAGEKIKPLILKSTLGLAGIGVIPFGLVFMFGPQLFGLIFGPDWGDAGEYARWIAFWGYFGFVNRPSNVALPVLSLLPFFLYFEMVSIFLRSVGLFLGFYFFQSALFAVAIFCIIGVFLNVFLIIIVLLKSSFYDKVIRI